MCASTPRRRVNCHGSTVPGQPQGIDGADDWLPISLGQLKSIRISFGGHGFWNMTPTTCRFLMILHPSDEVMRDTQNVQGW